MFKLTLAFTILTLGIAAIGCTEEPTVGASAAALTDGVVRINPDGSCYPDKMSCPKDYNSPDAAAITMNCRDHMDCYECGGAEQNCCATYGNGTQCYWFCPGGWVTSRDGTLIFCKKS